MGLYIKVRNRKKDPILLYWHTFPLIIKIGIIGYTRKLLSGQLTLSKSFFPVYIFFFWAYVNTSIAKT